GSPRGRETKVRRGSPRLSTEHWDPDGQRDRRLRSVDGASSVRILLDGRISNPAQIHQNGKVADKDRFRFPRPSDNVRWKNRSRQEDSERIEREVWGPCAQERDSKVHQNGRGSQQRNPWNNIQSNEQGLARVSATGQGHA